MIIAFEGLNGAGKTTLINKIFQWLRENSGKKIQLHSEPSGIFGSTRKELSQRVRAILYCAERAHTIETNFKAIQSDDILLFDRFLDSTFAYQIGGDGLPNRVLEDLNDFSTRGIRPTLTIFLRVTPELSKERSQTDLSIDYLQRVDNAYRFLETISNDYEVIDGSLTEEEVFNKAIEIIKSKGLV